MASISKLAVIISGVTKPLEDALKNTSSKVGAFGSHIKSSIGHGFGAGLGAMGLDKMEAAMKKAIADTPHLAEAAERAEKSFGNILLKVTGVGYVLPKVAGVLSDVADWMDGITPEMKKQKEIQANMLKAERQLADTRIEGLNAVLKTLDAQLDALDPMRERLRIADQLEKANDPYLSKNISQEQMSKPGYDPFAREKALAMQEIADADDYRKWAGEHDLALAEIEHDKYMEMMEEELEKIKEMEEESEKWQKIHDETIKQTDQEEEETDNWNKMYYETLAGMDERDQANSSPKLLSGAATAGSEAAYSIIANAEADKQYAEAKTQTIELKKQTTALQSIEQKTPKLGDFAFGVYRMELK